MSTKFFYGNEKTNADRPEPWNYNMQNGFLAVRGTGAKHRVFCAVGKNYKPYQHLQSGDGFKCPRLVFDEQWSKIITTKKGGLILLPASKKANQLIMFITIRSGFRSGFSIIEAVGGEILLKQTSSKHCCETGHLIVRIDHPDGFAYTETGRKSTTGIVDVFSWSKGYHCMTTEKFHVWREEHK